MERFRAYQKDEIERVAEKRAREEREAPPQGPSTPVVPSLVSSNSSFNLNVWFNFEKGSIFFPVFSVCPREVCGFRDDSVPILARSSVLFGTFDVSVCV